MAALHWAILAALLLPYDAFVPNAPLRRPTACFGGRTKRKRNNNDGFADREERLAAEAYEQLQAKRSASKARRKAKLSGKQEPFAKPPPPKRPTPQRRRTPPAPKPPPKAKKNAKGALATAGELRAEGAGAAPPRAPRGGAHGGRAARVARQLPVGGAPRPAPPQTPLLSALRLGASA